MKYFVITAAALVMTVGASATTITQFCQSFSNSTSGGNGSLVCPSFGSIDGGGTVTSATLIYLSDYSNGLSPSVTEMTIFNFSGGSLTNTSDTVTTTGSSSSSNYVSADSATFDAYGGVTSTSLAGFLDPISSTSNSTTISAAYTNSITSGSVVSATGYTELILTYTPTTTPEPGSMMLLGGGLLAAGLIGRKKLAGRN
jgi:hypothetical protein